MKNSKQDKKRSEFISAVITSIQMNPDDFMHNLANCENYEVTIHEWSLNLFNEEKSIDEAVKTIRTRITKVSGVSLLNTEPPTKDFILSKNYIKVMTELKLHAMYDHLSDPDQKRVQERVCALTETRLFSPTELTEYGINIIKNIANNKNKNLTLDSKNNGCNIISEFNNLQSKNIITGTLSGS